MTCIPQRLALFPGSVSLAVFIFVIVIGWQPFSIAEPFEEWAAEKFPLSVADRDPMADPDQDGAANLLEWYCGSSPSDPDGVRVGIDTSSAGVRFWFERSARAHGDVGRAELEASSDLINWGTSSATPQVVSTDGDVERLEADLAGLVGPLFFRLSVGLEGESESLASWSFDEAEPSGNTLLEDSGNGTDGLLKNGAARGEGVGGGAGVALDGIDDYMEFGLTRHLRLDSGDGGARAFTMAAWIKLDPAADLSSEGDDYAILQKGSWTLPPFVEFGVRGGAYRGLYAKMYNSSGSGHAYDLLVPREDVAAVIADDRWHHVAFARDGEGVGRLFLDGQQIAEKWAMASPADPPVSASTVAVEGADSPLDRLWIGRRYSRSGSYFDGLIDDVRLFRRALDGVDLADLIAAQPPQPGWVAWGGFPALDPDDTLYVAPPPLGDDANDGSESSPFATIGKALDVVHADVAGPSRVFVHHGEYFEGLDRIVSGDAPLSDRRPGELYIARAGITLEAEPWDGAGGRVVIKGSVRKDMPASHPLAAKYPEWETLGGGLFRADRPGRDLNSQAVYLDGELLPQYGDADIGFLTGQWLGERLFSQNDPAALPPGSFYCPEKLRLNVPTSGGRGIGDGQSFKIERGFTSIKFEFSDRDDYREGQGNIIIPFSDGRDVFGASDGSGDTQAELLAKIMAALESPAASVLGLTAVEETGIGVIELGERAGADGRHLLLATPGAPALSSHSYELYVKLPEGVDPNSPLTNLEIPYRPQLLAVRAPHTRVKGFRLMYNNAGAHGSGAAVLLNAADLTFEDNEVLWCDVSGASFVAKAEGGMRPPIARMLLLNNRFSFCGNTGFGGTASLDCRLVGNDTSENNWKRYRTSWHAGGFKLNNLHQQMVFQNHTARYNKGDGLWFDTVDPRHKVHGNESVALDKVGVEVSESVAEFNEKSGFFYEISRNGKFFDNVSRYNRQRGFYLSSSVNVRCERNLVVGNGLEGFGNDAVVRLQTRPFFSLPYSHPLGNNWWNTNPYGSYGNSGIALLNNISRNNALHDPANHDAEATGLALRAGLAPSVLPRHFSPGFPLHTLPSDTGALGLAGRPPLVGATAVENTSDHNVFWRTNEVVMHGSSPAQSIGFGAESSQQDFDGRHLDLKDIDSSTDAKADRVLSYEFFVFPSGLRADIKPFPNGLSFDTNSVAEDRFEFLDPQLVDAGGTPGLTVFDPDSDLDGMYDWWEAQHGLDPGSADGIHGGGGDADGDGRTNLVEFQNWIAGGEYASLEDFFQATDPTYLGGGRHGGPRDLDGDRIPDLWESYYGIGGVTESEGQYLDDFLRGRAPGPLALDIDADGLPDPWEQAAFGSLEQTAESDFDGDGFDNLTEFRHWTLPFDREDPPDRDADGLSDLWEQSYGIDPTSSVGISGAEGDADGDGSSNAAEFRSWSNPRDPGSVPLE